MRQTKTTMLKTCSVPFCGNTYRAASSAVEPDVTFHEFPSEEHLRSAWLRALSVPDTHLSDSAVVCSQHFCADDMSVSESGLRQIRLGAIPSTVLVCLTCLDTGGELLLMSRYKLQEAYVTLTGHFPYQGNLHPTICVQCAERLRTFSRFREQSLRVRSLMMNLLERHRSITMRHMELIHCEKVQLNRYFVTSPLRPEQCEFLTSNFDDNRQTTLEDNDVVVKIEDGCTSADEEMKMFYSAVEVDAQAANGDEESLIPTEELLVPTEESLVPTKDCSDHSLVLQTRLPDEAVAADPLKCEDDEDKEDIRKLIDRQHSAQALVASLSARRATDNENNASAAKKADTTRGGERALVHRSASHDRPSDSDDEPETITKQCGVKLYDVFKNPSTFFSLRDEPLTQTRRAVGSSDTYTASEDAQYRAASENKVAGTHNEPESKLSETVPYSSTSRRHTHTQKKCFTCDVCQRMYERRNSLLYHLKTHSKPYSCRLCNYKCAQYTTLLSHVNTHTGEKPYSCTLCAFKCADRSNLGRHMKTHADKTISCKICSYKCAQNDYLVTHMRTHTGEKPYSCKLCSYKCAQETNLVKHIRIHTGEKPYSCKFCDFKCKVKSALISHTRTHTGEKPYSCKLCDFKFAIKYSLTKHARTHFGGQSSCS